MEKKLFELYEECINELKSINIFEINDVYNNIDIKVANRNNKRYGLCRHENPDISTKYIEKRGRRRIVKYKRYNRHHIEISRWVLDMNDEIIKNTIIHEIIHCFKDCNNHLSEFKKYARYINEKLGYNISRLGDKEKDYLESGIKFKDKEVYKYKIVCESCNMVTFRKRFNKNKIKKYRCAMCKGKLSIIEL